MTKLKDYGIGEPVSEPAEPVVEPELAKDESSVISHPVAAEPGEGKVFFDGGIEPLDGPHEDKQATFEEHAGHMMRYCEEQASIAKANLHHTVASVFTNLKQDIGQAIKTVGKYKYHEKIDQPGAVKTQLPPKQKG
jgi:hypothetical protein